MYTDASKSKVDYKSKKYLAFQFAFFAGAVLVNFILPRAVSAMGLPLYLDNVGTLAAAVLGGYAR